MPTINTFTLYAHYASVKDQSITRLKQLRSALFQDIGPFEDDSAYLESVVIEEAPYFALIDNRRRRIAELETQLSNPDLEAGDKNQINQEITKLDSEIADMNVILNSYLRDQDEAVANYQESAAQLQSLIDHNNTYLAPHDMQDEYLFWLDERTCNQLLKAPSEVAVDQNNRCFFKRVEPIVLEAEQTDAVRVSANHVTLDGLVVEDTRAYDTAHRDAVQLIPPPKVQKSIVDGRKVSTRLADQLAGTVLNDVIISGCQVRSDAGVLQGIFASDGLFSNISINQNDIRTRGVHSISLAGLLDRSHITNNVLHQINPDVEPAVRLYPLRIGGNTAEEGVVIVLSFAESNQYAYDKPVFTGNVIRRPNGDEAPALLQDMRNHIPVDFEEFAVGLNHFDYDSYFFAYTHLSIGDFKTEYATEYASMRNWLATRIDEYSNLIPGHTAASAESTDEFLHDAPVADEEVPAYIIEKTEKILPRLIESLATLDQEEADMDSTFWATRLGSLHDSPIRNYVMKAIAIRHGEIELASGLSDGGDERQAENLRFLLNA